MKALYVHIPFCARKCFYCSFVVAVGQERRIDLYLDSLDKEARRFFKEPVSSVYIGGGTPSVLSERQLARLCGLIKTNFVVVEDAEWTVEANPDGLTLEKLEVLNESGVNRLSLGVQSWDDPTLAGLGRTHSAQQAGDAFRLVREAGFENINVDMIFGLPGVDHNGLRGELSALVMSGSDHVSLYALTIEEHSRFFARQLRTLDGVEQAAQYVLVCDLLKTAGYQQYEVSNFAKQGKWSRHNLNYWLGGEYIGLGVGAHSFIGHRRSWNISKITEYLDRIQKGVLPEQGFEELTCFDRLNEIVLFGLRMNAGVDIENAQARCACCLREDQWRAVDQLIEGGFLAQDGKFVKATDKGRLVLDEICARLI